MSRTSMQSMVLAFVLLVAPLVAAQTTLPGSAVDIEIYNPFNGSNAFCVAPSEIFAPRVFFRPGTGTLTCDLDCSPPSIPGGSANIATAVIDIAFDPAVLSYVPGSIQNNTGTAAVQGMAQAQNIADSRIGWALAGTWSAPGDPSSTLASPCGTQFLTAADWLFQTQFQATGYGLSSLHLRGESDSLPFALSFADICGTAAFKRSNGGIDEARSAVVLVSDSCTEAVFFDNFGTGDESRWSMTTSAATN